MFIFFYLFATLITISSFCVVLSKNSVYSVLWLIFAFINGSGLMILLGAEFLAMMLIVIYVGAVAVLFLFVIMMLDMHFIVQFKEKPALSILVALIMFADLVAIILLGTKNISFESDTSFAITGDISNTKAIGNILYTDFMLPFQISGLILFVAMISCITLTLRKREGVKRQNIAKQLTHNKENTVLMTKPLLHKGIEDIKYE